MEIAHRVSPCVGFDDRVEEAARFHTSVFPNSRMGPISRYGEAGEEVHGRPPGSVLTVAFELDGQPLTALDGSHVFRFNEAVSLQLFCDPQEEADRFCRAHSRLVEAP